MTMRNRKLCKRNATALLDAARWPAESIALALDLDLSSVYRYLREIRRARDRMAKMPSPETLIDTYA